MAAVEDVVSGTAFQRIQTLLAVKPVISLHAADGIVTGAALERIVSFSSLERIRT